jgi:L-ascorbate metabolism protein UlaG (beta-lactamase superfamily)
MPATAITLIGGPTALLEYAGLRIVLDPTFDAPRTYPSPGTPLVKTAGPALPVEAIEPVDLVLLSHHAHEDNLDDAGRELALRAPLTLSTPQAAAELGSPVIGLEPWQEHRIGEVVVTGMPGHHGPRAVRPLIGPVVGFLLQAPGEPTVYVSGDNSSLKAVKQIAERYASIDIAILFAGAARVPVIPAALTLSGEKAAQAAALLGAKKVVGVHVEDWKHFSEGRAELEAAFAGSNLLVATPRGERVLL